MTLKCDVLILGGGPAGSTTGTLLKKYNPDLKVVILEREKFPRDHIGESQLPAICEVLEEMGCWDKVEAAEFPIKIGATYRWGTTDEFWHLNFLFDEQFKDQARPAKYKGQRRATAFQVDRSVYDEILLDHAAESGCEVYQEVRALKVNRDGDRVTSVELGANETALKDVQSIEARYYVDATGNSGLLRRAMGVEIDSPTNLRNIAMWDYWQNAEWAVNIGVGGTRIQVMSLGWGWIWFIPLSATRTSIGLVTPAEYYKKSGKKTEELYMEALASEPLIGKLTSHAHRENKFTTTNDWSYVADRLSGENWFLVGDSCGFADPILSAGMTLAHTAGRRVAYAILELDRGTVEAEWVRESYDRSQKDQIRHHIRFADFWYSANTRFTELKENCSAIAKHAGLTLEADAAFQWMSTGGFTNDDLGSAHAGTFSMSAMKAMAAEFTGGQIGWAITKNNHFKMNLVGATEGIVAHLEEGRMVPVKCYFRDGKKLPIFGLYAIVQTAVLQYSDAQQLVDYFRDYFAVNRKYITAETGVYNALQTMESMVTEGWIKASVNPKRPNIDVKSVGLPRSKDAIHQMATKE
jgi:flavin-dependent dehydrogenase